MAIPGSSTPSRHVLFFGHIGSGKSTELRQYLDRFAESDHYLPVEVNVLTLLDSNNLAYSEVLMVFLIDGTDKLRGEDTDRFFIYAAEQLLAIETLAIYTAPLQLKYDGRIVGRLDADLVLPMMRPSSIMMIRVSEETMSSWCAITSTVRWGMMSKTPVSRFSLLSVSSAEKDSSRSPHWGSRRGLWPGRVPVGGSVGPDAG